MQTTKDSKTKQSLSNLMDAMDTDEGRAMAEYLVNNFGGSIDSAIAAAQKGNLFAAKKELAKIMSTSEGAKIAEQILGVLGK